MTNAAYLELDQLALGYPSAQGLRMVVQDFSLHLERGRTACLLGPSGCGKSSILRAIAGFEPLRSGSIRLGGIALSHTGFAMPPEHRQVGMMFQDYALFPHLNVQQNIAFGLSKYSRAQRQQRTEQMLELVGLREALKAWPHELSGGQQQRIALARALAPEPALLLLDEPFSNLDTNLRERLAQEVRDILQATGQTAILVTHNHREADIMGHYIGTMQPGEGVRWSHPTHTA